MFLSMQANAACEQEVHSKEEEFVHNMQLLP